MNSTFVYLASTSPRRRELLQQIGVPYRLLDVSVDEAVQVGEAPIAYVTRLAAAKAEAGWLQSCTLPVVAADTTVACDGHIMGKPADRLDAAYMLLRLAGRTHEVFTAVAVASAGKIASRVSRSEVTLRAITEAEAHAYWDTGEPADKAGAYAIQGRAAVFVAGLQGSYSGVMGLPLYETAELLLAAGIPRWL